MSNREAILASVAWHLISLAFYAIFYLALRSWPVHIDPTWAAGAAVVVTLAAPPKPKPEAPDAR